MEGSPTKTPPMWPAPKTPNARNFRPRPTAYEAANKVCRGKNAKLVQVSSDILAGYRELNMWKVLAAREPMIGFGGVAHENPGSGLS